MTPQHLPPPDYLTAWHALEERDSEAPRDIAQLLANLEGEENED
jgi:hypothetical protein